MRLIKCYVDGFGKLKDLEYNFEDGLNCFVRKNGWGKSTFAAFIRIMFYGFEGESKRNLLENERKYYKPWTGDVYGGEIRFEAGGQKYIVFRGHLVQRRVRIGALSMMERQICRYLICLII